MRGDREYNIEKVERSMPVSARVDLCTLARLDRFWSMRGVRMRSLSKLINWSLEAFIETLEDNQLVGKDEELMDVRSAYDYLCAKDLKQESIMKRGGKKLMNGVSMNNLRNEGDDPEEIIPRAFKMMHKNSSIEAYDGSAGVVNIENEECSGTKINWDEVDKQVAEAKRVEIEETKRKGIALINENENIKEEENENERSKD
jgi:hypothetical protein